MLRRLHVQPQMIGSVDTPLYRAPSAARVLVIEDDADERHGMAVRLRHDGYDTAFAEDVPAAIRAARNHKPDVILLDLGLPGGDGYTVMSRLKAIPELSHIPVIVISAREPAAERERAIRGGAMMYFQKPIRNSALHIALQRALKQ